MNTKTFVGTVISDGDNILLCHSCERGTWIIPCGVVKPLDTFRNDRLTLALLCMRDLKEKTGLTHYKLNSFNYLGKYDVVWGEVLELFYIFDKHIRTFPLTGILNCESFFEREGRWFKKVDEFKSIPINQIDKYCEKRMAQILAKAFESLRSK